MPNIDNSLLGNPKFLNDSDYEQDKVITIQEFLKTADVEQSKRIIAQYVDIIVLFWSYGFSDCAFKVGNNNGVNPEGEVIQIDFGELVTEKGQVERILQKKPWQKDFVGKRLSAEMREYHNEFLSQKLTPEKLNEVWGCRL